MINMSHGDVRTELDIYSTYVLPRMLAPLRKQAEDTHNNFVMSFLNNQPARALLLIHRFGYEPVLDSLYVTHEPNKRFLLQRLKHGYNVVYSLIRTIYDTLSHHDLTPYELTLVKDNDAECECAFCQCLRENQTQISFLQYHLSHLHGPYSTVDFDVGSDDSDYDDVDERELEDVVVTVSNSEYAETCRRVRATPGQDDTCCVCLDKLNHDDADATTSLKDIVVKTPCGHFFHDVCLRQQLCCVGPPHCPLCRCDVRTYLKKCEDDDCTHAK